LSCDWRQRFSRNVQCMFGCIFDMSFHSSLCPVPGLSFRVVKSDSKPRSQFFLCSVLFACFLSHVALLITLCASWKKALGTFMGSHWTHELTAKTGTPMTVNSSFKSWEGLFKPTVVSLMFCRYCLSYFAKAAVNKVPQIGAKNSTSLFFHWVKLLLQEMCMLLTTEGPVRPVWLGVSFTQCHIHFFPS
jgi:hypothetical protein